MRLRDLGAIALSVVLLPALAFAQLEDVDGATWSEGGLPSGQSELAMKTQILLDRAHFSPGVIDGYDGSMTETALRAFQKARGLETTGTLDKATWDELSEGASGPFLTQYTITAEDMSGIAEDLPEDYAKLAERDSIGFTSVSEKLAERFHMDQDVLEAMNAEKTFAEGETIRVVVPGEPREGDVKRIEVDKETGRATAMDAAGNILASYPVTVGSTALPSPNGVHEVKAVAFEPKYYYNPGENFQQGDNDEKLTLPGGANNPVGLVWIDLSEPTYGLHGTPEPSQLHTEASHGCVRMTNWDAEELGRMVSPGTVVEFIE